LPGRRGESVSETLCLRCKRLGECEARIAEAERVLRDVFEGLGATSYYIVNVVVECRNYVEAKGWR